MIIMWAVHYSGLSSFIVALRPLLAIRLVPAGFSFASQLPSLPQNQKIDSYNKYSFIFENIERSVIKTTSTILFLIVKVAKYPMFMVTSETRST